MYIKTFKKEIVHRCPENFRESLSTPTATFAEIFNGLLFRSIHGMNGKGIREAVGGRDGTVRTSFGS